MTLRIANLDAACEVGASLSLAELMQRAAALRDQGFGDVVTYSRKVFIPLTELCRDVCHYCTFAKTPKRLARPYMMPQQVLDIARAGAALGCKEALFTLGDKPERRYRAARDALQALGFATTVDYVAAIAEKVRSETGLLPHINCGLLSDAEFIALRKVAPSMGLML
jgi:FO synthase